MPRVRRVQHLEIHDEITRVSILPILKPNGLEIRLEVIDSAGVVRQAGGEPESEQ